MKRWPTKPLREVGQLDRGRSRHRPRDEPKLYGGSYPFIQTGDVSNANGRITSYSQTYSELGLAQSRMWPAGTLCITIAANIGKTGVLTFPACFPDSIVGFIPGDQVRTDFVRYWFLTVQSRLEEQAPQAAQKNINLRIVGDLSVPLPPMAEQERILKLLDEADELRKLRAEADRRTAALIPALFHEMFGQHIAGPPVAISTAHLKAPREWRWAKLTEVACLATGHTPSRRHPEWWGGDVPWISLTDIRELDGTIATQTSECVNEEGITNSSSVKLPKGTVCFSRTASVGFVTVMGREMATSQDFVNWVCGPELDPIFLMGALLQAREHLRSLASGSTHKTIYFPTVEQFATILPPLSLQKEFAARVAEIRALRAEQSASHHRLDDLFKSLLHRAFNGEL